jgi:alkaline phosphatase
MAVRTALGLLLALMLTLPAYAGQAKYVFMFIGDGMGIPQRTAAAQYAEKELLMDTFPAQGVTSTFAADRFITGSAASATALASGQKTNINMLGMTPDMQSVKTMAELAKEKGMKVGIVSSVSIDHATPAAFYSHVKHRSQYYDVDVALAESGFDYFGGGGLKDPVNKKGNSENFKGDARELIKKAGYKYVTDKQKFLALTPKDGKVLAVNEWLQDGGALPYVMDMTEKDITLPEFTAKGIELLDNPKGFFMMVEGGKIDWACHANDATAALENTLAFDKAIAEAVAFYKKHPEETLIVVTGDHECGGLTLGFAGTKYASNFEILGNQNISFQKFTDEILKGLKETGKADLTTIKPLITKHFGLKFEGDAKADPMVLDAHEVAQIKEALGKSLIGDQEGSKNPETYILYGGYDPLAVSLTHILNQKAGLGWTSYKHTGVPVTTSAIGVGSAAFNGSYDNTDVAMKVFKIMGLNPEVHLASAK